MKRVRSGRVWNEIAEETSVDIQITNVAKNEVRIFRNGSLQLQIGHAIETCKSRIERRSELKRKWERKS